MRQELKDTRHAGTFSCEEAGAEARGLEIKRALHSRSQADLFIIKTFGLTSTESSL